MTFNVQTAVAIDDLLARNSGDALSWHHDACEVGRVGSGNGNWHQTIAVTSCTQRIDGCGKRELLAAETGDEAAAADFTPRFQAAENAEKIAPPGGVGLTSEKIAEEDSITRKQHAGCGFESDISATSLLDWSGRGVDLFREERPASGRAANIPLTGSIGSSRSSARVHHDAKLVEAVGSRKTGSGQLPERMLCLWPREIEDALDIVGETGSSLLEQCANLKGFGTERLLKLGFFDALLRERVGQPVGRLANVEGDGSRIGRDDAARRSPITDSPGWMRRDAAPTDSSRETERVEPARVVVGYTSREDCAFPLDGRSFEALELMQRFEDSFFTGELRLRCEMLPAEKPTHVGGWRDGFDLFAQRAKSAAMDTLQNTAFAPLDIVVG